MGRGPLGFCHFLPYAAMYAGFFCLSHECMSRTVTWPFPSTNAHFLFISGVSMGRRVPSGLLQVVILSTSSDGVCKYSDGGSAVHVLSTSSTL